MTADEGQSLLVLDDKKRRALEVLISGGSHAEAADAAGVRRETVSRWVTRNPAFVAALNRWRESLQVEHGDRMRRIGGKALGLVEESIEGGDIKAALAFLRILEAPAVRVELRPGAVDARTVFGIEAGRVADVPPPEGVSDFAWEAIGRNDPAVRRSAALARLNGLDDEPD